MSIPDDVAPWKYNKLLSNLGNAVGALTAEAAEAVDLVTAVRGEGEKVLRHAGIESFRSRPPRRRGRTDRLYAQYPDGIVDRATPPGSR